MLNDTKLRPAAAGLPRPVAAPGRRRPGMTVVVTGGCGFIGSRLVARLLDDPGVAGIRVIDDFSNGVVDLLGPNLARIDLQQGSILDPDLMDAAVAGADAIVHLAALGSVPRSIRDPLRSHEANATGTLHVLQAARRAGGLPVIAASSSSVYGAQPQLPRREDSCPMPVNPYAVSKLAAESYVVAFGHCYDLPVLALRFFNVYGPGQRAGIAYAAVVPTFIDAALHGRPVQVHGDGTQTRDLTHADTVCEVIVEALHRRVVSDRPVNLALGTRTSLLDLIELIGELTGAELDVVHGPARPGDIAHAQSDPARLLALFPGLRPKPLRDGLAETIAWHRARLASPAGVLASRAAAW